MVSFVCDSCQETLKKSKVEKHLKRKCSNASFSCVDCNKSFGDNSYEGHKECNGSKENDNTGNQQKRHKHDSVDNLQQKIEKDSQKAISIPQTEQHKKLDFFSATPSGTIKTSPTPPPTPTKDSQPQPSKNIAKLEELLKKLRENDKRVNLKTFRRMIKKTHRAAWKLWKSSEEQMEVTYDEGSCKYILKSHPLR